MQIYFFLNETFKFCIYMVFLVFQLPHSNFITHVNRYLPGNYLLKINISQHFKYSNNFLTPSFTEKCWFSRGYFPLISRMRQVVIYNSTFLHRAKDDVYVGEDGDDNERHSLLRTFTFHILYAWTIWNGKTVLY